MKVTKIGGRLFIRRKGEEGLVIHITKPHPGIFLGIEVIPQEVPQMSGTFQSTTD
jgi:hypothetical protein